MGKVIQQEITRFDKGIVNDPRIPDFSYAQLIKNFDAHTYGRKLVPYRSSESGDSNAATRQVQNFTLAYDGTNWLLYALGVKSATNLAEIRYKALTQTSSADLSDSTWTNGAGTYQSATNNIQDTGAVNGLFNLFVFYRQTNLIYFALKDGSTTTNRYIATYNPNGGAMSETAADFTAFTSIGQGIVHSKDDILYVPYYNAAGAAATKSFIASKNGTAAWTTQALILPDAFVPVSICEYGNYLAIGCQPASGIGSSKVYLWDRNTSLTTLSEAIDWGEGNLQILEEVEGHLIGISRQGVGASGQTNRFSGQITIRQYSGGVANVIKTFISGSGNVVANNVILPIIKQKVDHFLYFLMDLGIAGSKASYNHQGIWKIGRVSTDAPFALTFDRNPNNDAAASGGGNYVMKAFYVTGDYAFLSYTNNGTWAMDKTDDQQNWTTTSYYDSQIFNLGDSSVTKKLLGVTVFTEALGGSQTITLAYKIDQDIISGTDVPSGTASWTTIVSYSAANTISRSAVNIESSGVNLPQFKEIQFRITSTGGTKAITGFKFKAEIIDSDLY